MRNKDINDSRGRVTSYGFACGYTEEYEANDIRVVLWREHGTYHVRAHNHAENERLFWDCFDRLSQARKRYERGKRNISKIK
jgi:predicted metal-dependent hydrolase